MKRGRFEEEIASRVFSPFSRWIKFIIKTYRWEAEYELENIWRNLAGYTNPLRLMPRLVVKGNMGFYLTTEDSVLMYVHSQKVFWFTEKGEEHEWTDWCFRGNWPWGQRKENQLDISRVSKYLWRKIFRFIDDPEREVLVARYPFSKWWIHMMTDLDPMKSYFEARFKGMSLIQARVLCDRFHIWSNKRMLRKTSFIYLSEEDKMFWSMFLKFWDSSRATFERDSIDADRWCIRNLHSRTPLLVRKPDMEERILKVDFNGLMGQVSLTEV